MVSPGPPQHSCVGTCRHSLVASRTLLVVFLLIAVAHTSGAEELLDLLGRLAVLVTLFHQRRMRSERTALPFVR